MECQLCRKARHTPLDIARQHYGIATIRVNADALTQRLLDAYGSALLKVLTSNVSDFEHKFRKSLEDLELLKT